ncbi:30S ribosomal protein S7 [Candidatus Campbellbacteria bacterium CG10_big_fil_rev_8_21_14_0_10_35_52]|uniref:Small ribosomal subunit protein uS7 n=1 Tax=Candidatus Campbellbacteria bacterium CG10_big_fil_rev_8_21_14_0_10_35_52 TaxID=1974527 RepID=A0A2M6WUX2_9BACT|nr:MAG: 30S ribosomal protein S7 [Candidatus Campbellbacteria bacterium CG10_big_fil_rev_8_21_14_0_10_35_52]
MRRKIKKRKEIIKDSIHGSVKVTKFINYIMRDGKKNTARKVVYMALDEIKKREKKDAPAVLFETALDNVGPTMEVRSRRVGGANYQVPREVRQERQLSLAMRWIISAAETKKGSPMYKRLADELILASKNEGDAIKKRENVHKMAEANKAFAHFAW